MSLSWFFYHIIDYFKCWNVKSICMEKFMIDCVEGLGKVHESTSCITIFFPTFRSSLVVHVDNCILSCICIGSFICSRIQLNFVWTLIRLFHKEMVELYPQKTKLKPQDEWLFVIILYYISDDYSDQSKQNWLAHMELVTYLETETRQAVCICVSVHQ